jgi:hypothetical protein
MARIEWVQLRLNNWALWRARNAAGGLGFPSESPLMHITSTDRYREARLPIDEVDACKTDRAIESLKPDKRYLYETLYAMYVWDLGIKGTARRFGRAESTIHAQLCHADLMLSLWFAEDRAAKKSFTP